MSNDKLNEIRQAKDEEQELDERVKKYVTIQEADRYQKVWFTVGAQSFCVMENTDRGEHETAPWFAKQLRVALRNLLRHELGPQPKPESTVRFDLRVPNDDEGYSLGTMEASSLPRVGEKFVVHGRVVSGNGHDPLIAKVTDVVWEANLDRNCELEATVWLEEEAGKVKIYCVCTDEERALIREKARLRDREDMYEDLEGLCFNCGKPRP